MVINRYKLFENIAFVIFFLIFSGYYVVLILVINLFGHEATRFYTIPLRFIIILLLLFSFGLNNQVSKKHTNQLLFYIFSFFYLYRILYEIISSDYVYHIKTYEFLLFYMSFIFLPFILIRDLKVKIGFFDKYENAIIYSGIILSILTIYYYGELLGTDFVRINYAAKLLYYLDLSRRVLSPLTLSYSSAMIINVSIMKLFFVQDKKHKVFLIATILFSMVPFYLGASRGSVVALLFGFVIFICFLRRGKLKIKFVTLLIISIPIIIIIGTALGSGLYGRTINILNDIESHNLQLQRVDIWIDTFTQFQQDPIIGKYLENINYRYHPHNILLESLISTGVIGFTILITLLINVCYMSIKIIKYNPRYSYISIIFYHSLTYSMFSGGLYKAIWLFVSMVMVIKYYEFIMERKNEKEYKRKSSLTFV